MKRLSGLDATFLHLETPEMPMHVGALHVFELPRGFKGRFVDALRRHMRERLALTPALRRRLWMMPMNITNPVWVDAAPDLRHHVVEVKLPKERAGEDGLAELEAVVARLHMQRLDRDRPLWRFHVIEGLAPGSDGEKRVAMYSQLHHAAVDGQAAVALANAILDLTPEPRAIELKDSSREKRFELSLVELVSGAVTSEVQQVAHLLRALPGAVGAVSSTASRMVARSRFVTGRKAPGALGAAPRNRFTHTVTERRAFAAVSLPLTEAKALGRRHDATLNDVVLWLCSTALRAWLAEHGELTRQSLVAAVPVSLRTKGDTRSDNQASMTLLSLGTHIADPSRRLAHVRAAARSMKSTLAGVKNILPTDFPSVGVPWLMEFANAIYRRATASDALPPVANVVISNVPGPPVPLYLAGAKMLTNYPCSIVVHGMALNITVQSYDQSLDCGLMADAQAMPDVRRLAVALRDAFDALRELPVGDDHERPSVPRKAVSKEKAGRARVPGAPAPRKRSAKAA